MKKYLFTLFALVLLAGTSCQEKIDIEKEKEAIIAVIQDEKDGFTNMDMEQWSRNVLQDSSYTWMGSTSDMYIISRGFSEQVDQLKEFWSNWDPDETRDRIEFEVMELKISPQAAWVLIDLNGQIETLFLEKIEGTWLISGQTILVTSSYQEVDENEEEESKTEDTE